MYGYFTYFSTRAACKITRCTNTWWMPPHLSFGCSCNVSKHNFNKPTSGIMIFLFIILVFSRIFMLSMFFQWKFVKSICIRGPTLLGASRSEPSHLVVILLIFFSFALFYSASCYWLLTCISQLLWSWIHDASVCYNYFNVEVGSCECWSLFEVPHCLGFRAVRCINIWGQPHL